MTVTVWPASALEEPCTVSGCWASAAFSTSSPDNVFTLITGAVVSTLMVCVAEALFPALSCAETETR